MAAPDSPTAPSAPRAPEACCALGTSFALRERGPGEAPGEALPQLLIDEALQCGAAGLLLAGGLPPDLLAALLPLLRRRRDLPVVAVDGQLGAAAAGRPRLAEASLCAADREEAQAAAGRVSAALTLAAECGAEAVLVQLGPVRAVASRWDGLRRRFLRGELLEDPEPAARLMAERRAAGAVHLAAARRSLERLAAEAERRGLQLLLRNPRRGIDLPDPLELRALLGELAGGPVAPILDVPAAHLCSAMRLQPLRETITAFAAGPLCLLGDACGAVGALPPGHGEVDVAAVARFLPREVRRIFLPWPGLHLHEVRLGCERVAALPRRAD